MYIGFATGQQMLDGEIGIGKVGKTRGRDNTRVCSRRDAWLDGLQTSVQQQYNVAGERR